MIAEKSQAGLDLGMALATGAVAATPEQFTRHALRYGRRRVRANIRRLMGENGKEIAPARGVG